MEPSMDVNLFDSLLIVVRRSPSLLTSDAHGLVFVFDALWVMISLLLLGASFRVSLFFHIEISLDFRQFVGNLIPT